MTRDDAIKFLRDISQGIKYLENAYTPGQRQSQHLSQHEAAMRVNNNNNNNNKYNASIQGQRDILCNMVLLSPNCKTTKHQQRNEKDCKHT